MAAPQKRPNVLEDPIFQQQTQPPVDPNAPVDPASLVDQGHQAFPPLADVDSYAVPPDPPVPGAPPAPIEESAPIQPPPMVPGGTQSTSVTTDQRIVRSPDEIAAAKDELAAGKSLVDATKTEQEALAKSELAAAGAERDRASQAQEIEAARAADLENAELDRRAKDQVAIEETAKAEEEVKRETAESGKTPFTGNLGASIFAALITGASSRNAYIMGKDPNDMPAVRAIDGYIERDKATRLSKLALSKEFLAEKRKGPAAARQAWLDAVDRINIQSDQRLKVALAQADTLKANGKVDKGRLDAIAQAAIAKSQIVAAQSARNIAERGAIARTTVTTKVKGGPAGLAGQGKYPIFDLEGNQVGATDQLKLANDAAEKRAGTLDSQRLGAELAAHIKKEGMTVAPGEAKAKRKALQTDLVSALVKARSGTAASDVERKSLTETVVPGLLNQVFSSRGDIVASVNDFVSREVSRYQDFASSSSGTPRATTARMGGTPPTQPTAAADISTQRLHAGLKAAAAAGDKAAAANIAAEIKKRGG